MKNKFKKHRSSIYNLAKRYLIPIKPNILKVNIPSELCRQSFLLTEEDQISYVYSYVDRKIKGRTKRKILEITCVSYEILIGGEWKTIVYYDDTHHGVLHRHEIISIDDTKGEVTEKNIKQKGGRKALLNWAIKELTRNSSYYKKTFLKRNALLT